METLLVCAVADHTDMWDTAGLGHEGIDLH